MANNIAIRLNVEGQAEVRRALEDTGRAGQAALGAVTTAATAAGAATDQLARKSKDAADAARQAQAAADAAARSAPPAPAPAPAPRPAPAPAPAPAASAPPAAPPITQRQAEAIRGELDPVYRIQRRLAVAEDRVNRGYTGGYFDEAERDRLLGLAGTRYGTPEAPAPTPTTTGWAGLSAAGRAELVEIERRTVRERANAEAARRLGSLGMGPAANQNAGRAPGRSLRSDEITNLIYQGGDVLGSAASGMSPAMIALQQGPQIAQIFAGPEGASLKTALGKAGEAVTGFVGRIGLLGGAVGVLTLAAGTSAAALMSYRSSQDTVRRELDGTGRASGATIGQVNAVALANASAAGVSVGAAREMAAAYAGTGRIGTEMYAGLLRSAKDFARMTGEELPEANKTLAAAFADPVKGADALNAKLGFLTATTRENIERLAAQGDRLGAQKVLFDAYSASLSKASDSTTGWGRLTAATGEVVANTWDKIGRNISKALFGGTIDQELVKARERLSKAQVAAEGGFGLFSSRDVEKAQEEVDKLSRLIEERDRKLQEAQTAQRSLELSGTVRALLPEQQSFKQLQDRVTFLRTAIAQPVKFGLDARGLAEVEGAFERIARILRTATEEVERFGTQGAAAAVRTAEFANRMVGATGYGRATAEAEEAYQTKLRERGLDPKLTVAGVSADYDRQMQNPDLDARELQAIARARETALIAAREREAWQKERDTAIDTARRSESTSLVQQGGAFARFSPEVQRQILAAGQANPRVSPGLIAGIVRLESGGNLDVGFSKAMGEDGRTSSAYGLGQITKGTAAEAIRGGYLPADFDRTNRETMAAGIAGVLAMKIDQNGGDVTRGIMAYRGSRDVNVNRRYAADVMRTAGQSGDLSESGIARDVDANARALKLQQQELENATKNYGSNGRALAETTLANKLLSDAAGQGRDKVEGVTESLKGLARQQVDLDIRGKVDRVRSDQEFDREQLGRTSTDQAAYSRARSVYGDTSSPEAKSLIDGARLNEGLRQTKDLATGALSGLLSDLRAGTGFMTAMSNAAGRMADRLISLASDRAISALFDGLFGKSGGSGGSSGGGTDAGGAIGSLIKSVFGSFDVGGYTGPGGRLEAAGIVHRGEVVFSQADVQRHGGVAAVEAMRRGTRGYDGGGVVGGFTMPTAMPAAGAAPTINFVTPPGMALEADGPPQRRADGSYDQVLKTVEGGIAARAKRGKGPLRGTIGGAWNRIG